jgi:cyanophycinase-like exopeptidase
MRERRSPAPRRGRRAAAILAIVLIPGALLALSLGLARGWAGRSLVASRRVLGSSRAGYTYSEVGNPADVNTATRPGLVLEGGGTDIDDALRWMIGRSGGGDFLVIRTTGTDAYNNDIYDLTAPGGMRADSVATLIVTSRAAAFDPFVARTIRSAEALWIAGGDQAMHYARWRGTPVADAIHDLVARGVPVGGTSSGLAVMGEYTYTGEGDGPGEPHLTSAQALCDPHHPRVTVRRDFLRLPFLGGVILEPHFLQESRYGRMAVFLNRIAAEGRVREARGIGIDRRTALLVEPDGSGRIITRPEHPFGKVVLFRLAAPPAILEPGRALSATHIEVEEFGRGGGVDLLRWGGTGGVSYRLSIEGGVLTTVRRTR